MNKSKFKCPVFIKFFTEVFDSPKKAAEAIQKLKIIFFLPFSGGIFIYGSGQGKTVLASLIRKITRNHEMPIVTNRTHPSQAMGKFIFIQFDYTPGKQNRDLLEQLYDEADKIKSFISLMPLEPHRVEKILFPDEETLKLARLKDNQMNFFHDLHQNTRGAFDGFSPL